MGTQKLPAVVQLLPDASVHVVSPLFVLHWPLFVAAVCWPALPLGLQMLPGWDAGVGGLHTLAGLGGAGGVGLQTLLPEL